MSETLTWARTPPWARRAAVATLILVVLAVLVSLFDWNLLRGVVSSEASALAGRSISIRGDLKVRLLSLTPGATANDVSVGGTSGAGGGDLAHIGAFSLKIKLLPLLIGRVELPLVDLEQPQIWAVRNRDGLTNWRSASNNAKPAKLPPIQHFVINAGQLQLVDQQRKLVLRAQLQSSETVNGAGQGTFQLLGRGAINRDPFSLNLSGGPLIDVRTDRPYPFNADLRSGQTHIIAQGVLPHPFDLGQVRTALSLSGGDLADLYQLTGVALPNTSPYRLRGDLVRDERKYTFTNVAGTVGDSDLEGAFQLDHNGPRPKVRADLSSRELDMRDLAAVLGAPVKGRPRTALQQVQAAQRAARHRLLPDATLDLTRIRSTDAALHYRAGSIMAQPGLPLRRFRLDLTLDHGVMTADPVAFGFPQGELAGKISVDARQDPAHDAFDLKVTNVRAQDFLAKGSASPPLEATIEARAKLTGVGDSVHQVASTADGEVTVVAPHGEVRQSLDELLGIDVSRALGLLLTHNQSQIGLRCAVADFQADHGVLTARNLVFDSDAVLAKGSGSINLADETLNLTLHGQPKSFRLVRLSAPITVTGPLSGPKFGVKASGAAAQAGASVALGALLGPLAAVLPFVDPGLAHDADCVGAIQSAQSMGVPVKTSATTPTNARAAPARCGLAAKAG